MGSLNLQGKVAFVTRASSGIGEATVLALAYQSARIAIAARRAPSGSGRTYPFSRRRGDAAGGGRHQ